MRYCTNCGQPLSDDDKFCKNCGTKADSSQNSSESQQKSGGIFEKVTGKISDITGGNGQVKLHLSDIVSAVPKKHSSEEAEDIFICGTDKTTPRLCDINASWPKPWLYSRIFLFLTATFIILVLCQNLFDNPLVIPGLITIGSFIMPVTVLVFFFEVNIPKNISFFTVLKMFLIGGCASLLCSLALFSVFPDFDLNYFGAIVVGIIEETGKCAIVALFIKYTKKATHCVNGLLIGAAIGAGFAAFESAGYAYAYGGTVQGAMEIILLRGFLAPGGHVAWAAILGYAIMLAKGDNEFSMEIFKSKKFWQLAIVPVVLHAIWDMPIPFGSEFYLIPILMTVSAWVVILIALNSSFSRLSKSIEESKLKELERIADEVQQTIN